MTQSPEPASAPGTAPSDEALSTSTPPGPAAVGPGALPARPVGRKRLLAGVVVGATVAGLGGWILGEYPFTGLTPYIAGVLFALVIAEIIISVSREHSPVTAVAAAVCSVGGLGLAVWISSGDGISPIPVGGWVAIAVGCAVALARGGIRAGGSRGTSSQAS